MKPFNLDAAARGEPIITRNGQEILFLAHDRGNPQEGRRLILRVAGNPIAIFAYESGRISNGNSALDAFMAPKKRTVWVNLYPAAECFHYESEKEADDRGRPNRIGGKAWPLEIEE